MSERILIEWNREGVSLLAISEGGGRSIRVAKTHGTVDHVDPKVPVSQAAAELKELFERDEIPPGNVTVVLPRESVVVRRLHLPEAPDDEMPDLVRFQAATRTSSPIENLALDYVLLNPSTSTAGRDAVTVTIDKEQLNRIRTVLEAAGMTVSHVTVSSMTIGNLVRAAAAPKLGVTQPELIVYQQGRRLELSIFDEGSLVFSHAMQLPVGEDANRLKPVKSELTRSIVALTQAHPDVSVQRCYYVSGHPDDAVVQLLRERFPNGFQQVDAGKVVHDGRHQDFEALVGAAIPEPDDRLKIDLVNPRKKREIPDRRRLYYSLAGGGVALLMLVAYGVFYAKKSALEANIALLEEQVRTIDQTLEKGKPELTDYQRVATWKEGDSNIIDLWNTLRELMPGTDRIYLKNLAITPSSGEVKASYIGTAYARTDDDIFNLYPQFNSNGFRVQVKAGTNERTDPDYPKRYELNVDLLRVPPDAKPIPKAGSNNPTAPNVTQSSSSSDSATGE